MPKSEFIYDIPELADLVKTVDYIDVRTVESPKTLREFTAASLSFMPGWMRFLYRVRGYLVRLLGTTEKDIPAGKTIAPEELPFTPGGMATFFQVLEGEEGSFWLAEARDNMISACYGVVREPLDNGLNRFHLITTATYLKWTGRLYFTIICPFHHIVVNAMARYALRTS